MYVKIHNQVWMVNVNLTMDAEDPKLNNTPIFLTKRINNNKQFTIVSEIYFSLFKNQVYTRLMFGTDKFSYWIS